MKKGLFILAASLMISGLSACSLENNQQDPNALPDGIMQPVQGSGAADGISFMPEIQPSAMPTNMK